MKPRYLSQFCCVLFVVAMSKNTLAQESLFFPWKSEVQEYVVAENASFFFVRAWGAGGGSSREVSGGAGGYASGYFNLPAGSRLKIVIGEGGLNAPGQSTAIYLDKVEEKNLLLVAGGGGQSADRSPGRGGGNKNVSASVADSKYVSESLFLPGDDGSREIAKPKYDCTRDYKAGVATAQPGKRGGHGLVVISRGSQDFCYTGSLQSFTVPGGVSSITVKAWGGGGGGSKGANRYVGAGAGYATRTIDVSAGEVYELMIAGGGQRGFASQSAAYGDGGLGYWHNAAPTYPGSGGGGGRSQLSFPIVVGGGGGGAGGGHTDTGDTGPAVTGVGGGATGGTGGDAGGSGGTGGTGGTQSAGGAGGAQIGDPANYVAGNGTQYQGGDGAWGNVRPGGGGGGGYYGGGGGGGGLSGLNSGGGSGGGGSSFPSTGSISGSGRNPGNATDFYLPERAGRGGIRNGDGGDGFIYITW